MQNPYLIGAAAVLLLAAQSVAGDAMPTAVTACLAGGDGAFQARVRGAIDADINWSNAQMSCEGGMRPNNKGVRVSIAGTLPQSAGDTGKAARLRFVFGITLRDQASGEAQALPTNLTVIVEGQQQLFATLGDDKCAVELFEVTPLLAAGSIRTQGGATQGGPIQGASPQRIHARGYCIGPATDLQGTQRVLVSTFEFTSQIKSGDEP
jgi:hypothetical protein